MICESIKPGRRPFYKYVTPQTALAILEFGTVRYGCPLGFNDPFDIQAGLHLDFDFDSFHKKFLCRLEVLASNPTAPKVDLSNVWGKFVFRVWELSKKGGFQAAIWEKMTRSSFRQLFESARVNQCDYKRHWEEILSKIRVFCVTERNDNLLMWAHYAADHMGVVFEFWSLPEEDNLLSVAQPVEYVKKPLPFLTELELVDSLTGLGELDDKALYRRYACTKSEHWKYEREWRVWYPYPDDLNLPYDDKPIRTTEFKAIYLGCRMDSKPRERMLALIKSKFPETEIFQARKAENEYALMFSKVDV